ncbi:class I SAM-dependent methyltransferase [Polynucleobacter antarcticus]|uniref:SAM-dependent methyltransferase n=1 Tax=Polynucleobacter antarcticus TaxID=1743162 RepID=A0A6M9PQM9_9BURK|nr:class I SAM-dependent methyltransferase [Polynucleobacter antarcticus]QKM62182.1 SAM-dependent methyltransferase [Polynucleobacter antarcticus]
MTSFSSDWLALREAADHRARDSLLQAQVIRYLDTIAATQTEPLRLIDLGSGTGSNLRALAPYLPIAQHWTLVDHDPALLHAARIALIGWADEQMHTSESHNQKTFIALINPLAISKGHKQITVEFLCTDLAKNIESVLALPADIITAAAFFDLVAEDWLFRFCNALSKPLYTVLSYNGIENWSPPLDSDPAILKAFHAHQQTDKGFGVAAGPNAINIMQKLLSQRHFQTICASSPWVLNAQDRLLIESLAKGSAAAVLETDLVNSTVVNQWMDSRLQADNCIIGHTDFFAFKEHEHHVPSSSL